MPASNPLRSSLLISVSPVAGQVTEYQGRLYGGKHPVPSAVDWDGDGRIDIVAGNAYGSIEFFRNIGTNRAPAWLPGRPVSSAGGPIQVTRQLADVLPEPLSTNSEMVAAFRRSSQDTKR